MQILAAHSPEERCSKRHDVEASETFWGQKAGVDDWTDTSCDTCAGDWSFDSLQISQHDFPDLVCVILSSPSETIRSTSLAIIQQHDGGTEGNTKAPGANSGLILKE